MNAFDGLTPTTPYTCVDGTVPPTTPFTTLLVDLLDDATGLSYPGAQQVIDYQGKFVYASDPVHVGTYTVVYKIGFHQESLTELTEVSSYTLIITAGPCSPSFTTSLGGASSTYVELYAPVPYTMVIHSEE